MSSLKLLLAAASIGIGQLLLFAPTGLETIAFGFVQFAYSFVQIPVLHVAQGETEVRIGRVRQQSVRFFKVRPRIFTVARVEPDESIHETGLAANGLVVPINGQTSVQIGLGT